MANILFLTQWYPTTQSPVTGIFIREHALAVSLYHQVFVLFMKGLDTDLSTPMKAVHEQDGPLQAVTISYSKPPLPKTSWIQRIRSLYKAADILTQSGIHPDILHANVYNTADLAYLLSRHFKIPSVLTEHSSAWPRNLLSSQQKMRLRFFINRLDLVMPVSRNLGTHLRNSGISTPILVIPNTINTDIFYPDKDADRRRSGLIQILVVASLVEVKGIDYLLNSLALLKPKNQQFHLNIVGEGPERSKLEGIVRHHNLSEQVTFLGIKSKSEIAELMRRSDFLALTSLWENQPVVILEALACGLPVLASNVGGVPEILNSDCGRLTEPRDIGSIVENLEFMLNNSRGYHPDLIAEYSRSKFSYSIIGESFSKAYQRVNEEHRR